MNAPAQIDGGDRERFIHGHDEVAGPIDAAPVPERTRHRFPERDADVLDGVVLVDVEIPSRVQLQIEGAMAGKQLEHVVEEPNPRMDVVSSLSVQCETEGDACLLRLAIDRRSSHKAVSSAVRNSRVCSTTPAVMRRQSAQPSSFERSRT